MAAVEAMMNLLQGQHVETKRLPPNLSSARALPRRERLPIKQVEVALTGSDRR